MKPKYCADIYSYSFYLLLVLYSLSHWDFMDSHLATHQLLCLSLDAPNGDCGCIHIAIWSELAGCQRRALNRELTVAATAPDDHILLRSSASWRDQNIAVARAIAASTCLAAANNTSSGGVQTTFEFLIDCDRFLHTRRKRFFALRCCT